MSTTANRLDLIDAVFTEAIQRGLIHHTADNETLNGRMIHLNGRPLINFGLCSYLGLEMDPRLKQGAIEAVLRYGTQFASSRAFLSAPPIVSWRNCLDGLLRLRSWSHQRRR